MKLVFVFCLVDRPLGYFIANCQKGQLASWARKPMKRVALYL